MAHFLKIFELVYPSLFVLVVSVFALIADELGQFFCHTVFLFEKTGNKPNRGKDWPCP